MMNYGTADSNGLTNYNGEHDGSSSLSTVAKTWLLDSHLETIMLASAILDSMAAGIIFIFSNTIMPSLATLDVAYGIQAMNTINDIIINPAFAIAFFGGLISGYPAVVMWRNPKVYSKPARWYAVGATLVFFFGEFLVTITQNVPRNNALQVVDPASSDGVAYWKKDFLQDWVAWNTARGIFAGIAAVLAGLSLSFMRK